MRRKRSLKPSGSSFGQARRKRLRLTDAGYLLTL